jgi:hypothetical protein
MSRDGATTFGDLLGQLDWLHIVCKKCNRLGRYPVHGLAATHGRDYKIPDWISEMTRDCPRRRSSGVADTCEATCQGVTPEAIAARLSPAARILLFCVASRTEWMKAGVTVATVRQMIVHNLVDRGPTNRLTLTDQGRAVLEALIRT